MDILPLENSIFYDYFGMKLWKKRHSLISKIIKKHQIKSLIDVGCNTGKFMLRCTNDPDINLLVGIDICEQTLQTAMENLQPQVYHFLLKNQRKNQLSVELYKASGLIQYDYLKSLNCDAVICIEFIEHVNQQDLEYFVQNIFGFLQPKLVVITTPNFDFNQFFDKSSMKYFPFRHEDHKFEFTNLQFKQWCFDICQNYQYKCKFTGVGRYFKHIYKQKSCQRSYIKIRFSIFVVYFIIIFQFCDGQLFIFCIMIIQLFQIIGLFIIR